MPRLRPGQPPLIPSAAAWNRHEDVSDWYHRNKARGEGGDPQDYLPPTDVVQVRNDSGADRREGDVLEIDPTDGLLDRPLPRENLWFKGKTPNAQRPFGILLFPAKHDATESNRGVTPLQVSGVCKAFVNITSAGHGFAIVQSGQYVLQSADAGPVEIIDKESGTGEKKCVVRFFPKITSALVMFRLEANLARGGTAAARLVDPATLLTQPGATITVSDDELKWFGKGAAAPSGNAGGDGRGAGATLANLGWASLKSAGVYSILSMGTWYRWISGTLEEDSWDVTSANVTGWDGEAVADGGDGTVTLNGACIEPMEGLFFVAVLNEITLQYQVVTICCPV
jgi:hypothetical protein